LGHVLFDLFEKLVMKVRVEIPPAPLVKGGESIYFLLPFTRGIEGDQVEFLLKKEAKQPFALIPWQFLPS
jgi:hypothetical protein